MRETFYGWCEQIFGNGLFDSVYKTLSLNPSTGQYADVWKLIEGIYNGVCVPLGMGLVLIYFMVNVIEKSMQQQSFDIEHMVKLLLKLFFGLYIIQHGLEIMSAIFSLGFAFLDSVYKAPDSGVDRTLKAWISLTGEGRKGEWSFWDSIVKVFTVGVPLLIPWMVSLAMKVVAGFVCYSRLIEFYIKTAAAPIALSDFFTEGVHGNGWKFIRGYIAVALQAGIIMLSVVIFNALAGALFPASLSIEYWDFLIKYLALALATIGVMLKSLSLTKEIVGAN